MFFFISNIYWRDYLLNFRTFFDESYFQESLWYFVFFFKYFINNCGWYSFVDLMKNIREMYVVMSTLALIIWTKLPSYKIKLNKQTNSRFVVHANGTAKEIRSYLLTWNMELGTWIVCQKLYVSHLLA